VTFIHYMQEAAIEASTALGFSPEWYREQGFGWVVRKLWVRYLAPLTYGDEVEAATWLSGLRGVRSNREYDLTRVRDGVRVARGRAEWVYMDAKTAQPTRIPDAWADAFPLSREVEDLGVRLGKAHEIQGSHPYVSRRRVQFHELDGAQHVNHAVYLRWMEEAYFQAVRAAGHPLEQTRKAGWMVFQGGHEVQYFAPALDNDNIEVVSWVYEMGKVRAVWTHEVYNADTRKLLARNYSLVVFVNLEGKPTPPSAQAIEDILRGPAS
jgi:acyl-CoA thioester hydrolase